MDDITVLVTGAGAPGIKGTLYSLENNLDNREIRTIGTDMNQAAVGRYLCDEFYQIPIASSNEYLSELLSICEKEGVDVLLPQNTAELATLAENRHRFEAVGTKVAVSSKESIEIANNKLKLMKMARGIGVPVPSFDLVDNLDDLVGQAKNFGWPSQPVVVKPPISSGMRGMRIIDESIDLKHSLYSEKPSGIYLKMKSLNDILGFSFPPLLVMEYLPGDEYTVDVLNADKVTAIPRRRDLIRSGITFNGSIRKNKDN